MKISIWSAVLIVAVVVVLAVASCFDAYRNGWNRGWDASFGIGPHADIYLTRKTMLYIERNKDGSLSCTATERAGDAALREKP